MEICSLYIHIPFCIHRCGYCDFNTYAGQNGLIPAYTNALCREIDFAHQHLTENVIIHSIYFGGGTPSLLTEKQLEQILRIIHDKFDVELNAEITLEANPGTVKENYLASIRAHGINRLSLGVQSAHPFELNMLERQHDYPTVIRTVSWARQAGFDNINLDLIFGLPEQQLETWQKTLKLVLGLHPEHFSLYALDIEPNTPFGLWKRRGLIPTPDPDLAADMYEWASKFLKENSYAQYEISNWAFDPQNSQDTLPNTPDHACRHNLIYWRNMQYFGFGAGAHGYFAGSRTANVLTPAEYIHRLSLPSSKHRFPATPATLSFQQIDPETEISETMITGFRLVREGIAQSRFQKRFKRSLEELFSDKIRRFIDFGLLEWFETSEDRYLRLTDRGRFLANQVMVEFV